MPPPTEPAGQAGSAGPRRPPALLERFTLAERCVHWTTAGFMLTLIATGAILYLPELSVAVGHRQVIALIHLYSGFGLPIPMAAGLLSHAYRADLRRLNRHSPDDRAWLRSRAWKRGRAEEMGLRVGKFNAGQKLNAAFMCGAILVMLGTGILMWFPHLVSVQMRTGATFVHDWLALTIGFVIIGHIWFALGDAQSRQGMRHGSVPRWWAQDEHGLWADEVLSEFAAPDADEHDDEDGFGRASGNVIDPLSDSGLDHGSESDDESLAEESGHRPS
jgi:formate dehydrogenase subunit gamma